MAAFGLGTVEVMCTGTLSSLCSPPVRPGTTSSSRIQRMSPDTEGSSMGSVIKKRRKRMAKKKHRKLLKRTRVQRRNKK